MFRVSVQSIDIQSQHSEHRRSEPLFLKRRSEPLFSESAFGVEAFRAIIFQRRSAPLFFRASVQSIGVQSHYFSEAFRAIIFQSKRSELMINQGFVYHILFHG